MVAKTAVKSGISSAPKEQDYALVAKSLVKQYKKGHSPALDNFSLKINKGEFFGLLGPNGAGKTTAISILSDLIPADSGTVTIMGDDLRKQAKIKKILGLVPQDIALYDNLTAKENLVFFAKLCGLRGTLLQQRVEQCLEFASIKAELSNRLVSTYSGGMKRRLNLAVGIVHEPQVLFLDEPTVGIDAQSRNLIHKKLAELNQNGMTILYTTHYMEEAQELCSRIGIIDDGRIVQQGTPDKLLQESGHSNLEDLFLNLTGRQLRDG